MAKLRSFGSRVKTPEEVREELFAAGWKPTMAYWPAPHPDPEIHRLLLELNESMKQKTLRRIREIED